jgi:hypothetical protein
VKSREIDRTRHGADGRTVVSLLSVAAIAIMPVAGGTADRPPLVIVRGAVTPGVLTVGAPMPLTVELTNNLDRPVSIACYSLTPTPENDETLCFTVQAVYRDGFDRGAVRMLARPPAEMRHAVPLHTVSPGQSLRIVSDLGKWKIEGEWRPGRYWVSVRVDGIRIDKQTTMSVLSELLQLEIR